MKKISGLIAAPFTPMHPDGSVNYEKIPEYASFFVRNSIDGAFLCGTSGEGFSLTREERIRIAEKWFNSAPSGFKIIIHVGGTGIEDSRYLSAHARDLGVFGIGSMSPVFFKPSLTVELADYCAAIAGSVPDLPFYFYHVPSFTGVYLSMVELLIIASGKIPNFAGIKYTHENLYEFSQCMKIEKGKYDLLHGQDETFLLGLVLGASGGVGGSYNHAASLYTGIRASFLTGDLEKARILQLTSQEFVNVLIKYRGNVVGGKRIMKLLGIDCGPNRIPVRSLTVKEEHEMRNDLERIGFFEYCNK